MLIRQINLDDHGRPEKVTAELSQHEALYLASILGKQNGIDSEKVMPGGAAISSELYNSLTGELFNRYWSGGALEALMEHSDAT
ncbi:hypothetical protein [Nocardiopsis alba]|uniref:hypothetical protein n=1 Tax=Nocardiopsis alba TaxID=53437 RepID=UPI0033AB73E4